MDGHLASRATQRTIRVFVSSTFRDMHAERDEMVKQVFPRLRQLCEKRGITLVEVDLRWGITGEEAAAGKVLPLCFAEIDNCRPYFISLLGERYGWISDPIPEDLLQQEPWLQDQLHKSVTELEILHGALNSSQAPTKAFFYFRDPAYLKQLPEGVNYADFASEGEESKKKLSSLKEHIRNSGFPISQYSDPLQLRALLLADFEKLIKELFPEHINLSPLEEEKEGHQAFAESRSRIYMGKEYDFQSLDEHVYGTQPPLLVMGESGAGKSALLANWALQRLQLLSNFYLTPMSLRNRVFRRARQWVKHTRPTGDAGKEFVVMHFIGATPQSSDWSSMLRRILMELKIKLDLPQEIPDQADALRTAFANWLHLAAEKIKLIIIIDGLDQLEDRDQALDLAWLPMEIPPNVRIILSTTAGRPLEEFFRRGWPTLTIETLQTHERERLINHYLWDGYRKKLSAALVKQIIASKRTGNPLYLRTLLEELRLFGSHEQLHRRVEYCLATNSATELFVKVLSRLEEDYERERQGLVRHTMKLFWAARHGLPEAELLDMLGTTDSPLPSALWSPLYLAIKDSLVSRSGFLSFFHKDLRSAVEMLYLPDDAEKNAARRQLINYFTDKEWLPRKVSELPWQLNAIQSWQELYLILADTKYLNSAWSTHQFEIKSYWARVEQNSSLRMIAAYRPVLTDPANHLEAAWPVCVLLSDTGHTEEALNLSRHLELTARRADDLEGLQANLSMNAALLKRLGDLDRAMMQLKEQERICRQLSLQVALAASLGNQAVILREQGLLDSAIALHKEEEGLYRQLHDLAGLSATLCNQAIVFKDKNDREHALGLFQEQERICRQIGDKSGLHISLGNQGMIWGSKGKLDKAEALLKQEEGLCRQLGDAIALQINLGNQALVQEEFGDYDRAMELLDEKERICRELDDPISQAKTLLQQAHLFSEKLGQPAYALPIAEEARRMASEYGTRHLVQKAEMLLNQIHLRLK
jgi:tetratricopeptide (TPR) repeat protein